VVVEHRPAQAREDPLGVHFFQRALVEITVVGRSSSSAVSKGSGSE
jgi:hypothetical protein